MNERQARAQEGLAKGGGLGQDSSKRSLRRGQNGDEEENDEYNESVEYGAEEETPPEKKISKLTFGAMIVVAILLSVLAFFLPFIGWLVGTVVMGVAYWALGVKFNKKNLLKFGACDVVELIPVINVIPTFILSVFLNLGPMVQGVEELANSIPGGELAEQVAKIALKGKK